MEGEASSPRSAIGNNRLQQGAYKCTVCHRSYTRVDHLSRHFRLHTAEKPYSCKICLKGFTRADLLKRHSQRHTGSGGSQTGLNTRSIRVTQACKGCTASKLKCREEKPCHRCLHKGIPCEYAGRGVEATTLPQTSDSTHGFVQQDEDQLQLANYHYQSPGLTSVDSGVEQQTNDESNASLVELANQAERAEGLATIIGRPDFAMLPPPLNHMSSSQSFSEYEDNTLAGFLNEIMANSMVHPYPAPTQLPGNVTPSAGGHRDLFDFGLEENMELDDRDYGIMAFYQGKIATNPITSTFAEDQVPEPQVPSSGKEKTAQIPIEGIALGIEAFQKSFWCWTPAWDDNRQQDQFNFVYTPEEMASPGAPYCQVVNENFGAESRDRIVAMALSTCERSEFPKIISSFPTAELLENIMHSFLASHLAQSDTWIHLPTFRVNEQRVELIGSILSAGALLSTSLTIRKLGFAIHHSVRLSIPKTCEANNSLTRDLGLLQAFALSLDVGLWSGNKRNMELSESIALVPITMLRRASRFTRSVYSNIIPLQTDEGATLEEKWRSWVQQEATKRLVFHLFIHDAQTSISLLVNPSISYAELSLPLPECRKLWLAKSSTEWKAIYLSKKSRRVEHIPSLQQCIHDASPATACQDWIDLELSMSIISYAIWGLISEYTKLNSIQKAYPPTQTYGGILIMGHRHQELCTLLQNLGVSSGEWRTTGGMTAPARMLHELLLMHLYVSFDDLQLFAGKQGEDEARRIYSSLKKWSQNHESRQAVWHAGQVIKAAKRLRRHQLRDFNAIAVYHASLAFWAYGVLSLHSDQDPVSNIEGGMDELIWLDGDETAETKMFITLRRGIPCFSGLPSDAGGIRQPGKVARLSNPGEVMMVILNILRDHSGQFDQQSGEMAHLPPLLENLSQLISELGNAATAMMGRS